MDRKGEEKILDGFKTNLVNRIQEQVVLIYIGYRIQEQVFLIYRYIAYRNRFFLYIGYRIQKQVVLICRIQDTEAGCSYI